MQTICGSLTDIGYAVKERRELASNKDAAQTGRADGQLKKKQQSMTGDAAQTGRAEDGVTADDTTEEEARLTQYSQQSMTGFWWSGGVHLPSTGTNVPTIDVAGSRP